MSGGTRKQLLILGDWFNGLYTALGLEKTLARDSDVQITLVNRENFNCQADYKSLLEEQVLRLQSLVACLLEKNEQLRQTVAARCEKG
jgi:NADH dehydrogenase FAD-containing subunit